MHRTFLALALLSRMPAAGQPAVAAHEERIRLKNGGTDIAATMLWPEATAPVPGLVIIHGSGDSDRDNPWTQAYAQALQARGVAVLYPDKRGCGGSTGDWRTSSFPELAGDASVGLRYLASLPGIDTARIGVVGFSQGGYVAAIEAADDTLCRFAASVSGGVLPLMDQMLSEVVRSAEATPMPGDQPALRRAYARVFDFAMRGGDWTALQDTLGILRERSAFMQEALATVPPGKDHWAVQWIHATGDFDPWPYWSRTTKPVVFLYGGRDLNVDVRASMDRITAAEHRRLSLLYFGGNAHTHFRDDALDYLARWIKDKGID